MVKKNGYFHSKSPLISSKPNLEKSAFKSKKNSESVQTNKVLNLNNMHESNTARSCSKFWSHKKFTSNMSFYPKRKNLNILETLSKRQFVHRKVHSKSKLTFKAIVKSIIDQKNYEQMVRKRVKDRNQLLKGNPYYYL